MDCTTFDIPTVIVQNLMCLIRRSLKILIVLKFFKVPVEYRFRLKKQNVRLPKILGIRFLKQVRHKSTKSISANFSKFSFGHRFVHFGIKKLNFPQPKMFFPTICDLEKYVYSLKRVSHKRGKVHLRIPRSLLPTWKKKNKNELITAQIPRSVPYNPSSVSLDCHNQFLKFIWSL